MDEPVGCAHYQPHKQGHEIPSHHGLLFLRPQRTGEITSRFGPFDSIQCSPLSRLCAGTGRGRFLRQAPGPGFDYSGMISGLLFGNFAMVALLTFKCCATIAGGVRVIQSDRETSAKYGALKTSRNCRSVSPVFLI